MTLLKKMAYSADVDDKKVQLCLSGALKNIGQVTASDKSGKESIFADASKAHVTGKFNLNVLSFKIPVGTHQETASSNRPLHPKINRVQLSHGLADAATSVLLVTKDHPKKGNFKICNDHFLQKITSAGCNHLVSEIMCLSQLRDEYSELEAVEDLSKRIDVVLCDNSLVKIVPRLLAGPFNSRKKFPIGIKMDAANLQREITRKLSSTSHKLVFRNTQSSIPFGLAEHGIEKLSDNLQCCLQYLDSDKFPGGWSNVKSLYISVGLNTRVPLYVAPAGRTGEDVDELIICPEQPDEFVGDIGFGNIKVTASGVVLAQQKTMNHDDGIERMRPDTIRRKRNIVLKRSRQARNYAIVEEYKQKHGVDFPVKRMLAEGYEVKAGEQNPRNIKAAKMEKPEKKKKPTKIKKMKIHTTHVEGDLEIF